MDRNLELYLDTFDKHLKSVPTSERIDIIKEIKSAMIEMEQKEGLTPQQITEKLGNPKDLAQAYLGESISKTPGFNWQKWKTVIAFYGAAGFSSMFVIPVLGILSPVLKLCGYFVPLAGLVKLIRVSCGIRSPHCNRADRNLRTASDLQPCSVSHFRCAFLFFGSLSVEAAFGIYTEGQREEKKPVRELNRLSK